MERAIEVATTLPVVLAQVRDILLEDPGRVLCDTCTADERHSRRLHAQLSSDLRGGTSLHQQVEVQLGVARSLDGGGVALPIAWRPAGHGRLLPTFDGELEATSDRTGTLLRLHGTPTVPLGAAGRFGEAVAGRQIARRSLSTFLADVAQRLDAEADRRLKIVPKGITPRKVAVHDHIGSDNYVG